MSDPVESAFSEQPLVVTPAPPEPPPSRWDAVRTVAAWLLIVGLAAVMVAERLLIEADRDPSGKDTLGLLSVRMQARNLVGSREVSAQLGAKTNAADYK